MFIDRSVICEKSLSSGKEHTAEIMHDEVVVGSCLVTAREQPGLLPGLSAK